MSASSTLSQRAAGSIDDVLAFGVASRRAVATCAGLLLAVAVIEIASGGSGVDETSYQIGYDSASDGSYIRTVMTKPGVTSTSLCDGLFARQMRTRGGDVVQSDFISGCHKAIADAME